MNYTITGLEPGAGHTGVTDLAIETYASLNGWKQDTSSTGAMLTSLDQAIKNEEPIVFNAWSPHYMFAKWDIKYLEDPENVYGSEEAGTTLTTITFKDEQPEAYAIVDQIHFEVDDIEQALLTFVDENLKIEDVAQQWIDEHTDEIATWTKDLPKSDGDQIELVITPWDEAQFTGFVAKFILEGHGFTVNLTPVDPAILFESLATGKADVSLSPWLPVTHAAFYEAHKDKIDNLGPAFEGAKMGLAVPTYMEENSISDFSPAP